MGLENILNKSKELKTYYEKSNRDIKKNNRKCIWCVF